MMEYRQLGRTGLRVSPLCLGSMTFGNATDTAEANRIVDRALDAGLNFVDTANIYSNGESERIVGAALARNGKRQRVILATKVHVSMDPDDPNAQGNHRRHVLEQCDASLRRLGTEWIDIYYIHRPSTVVPIDETLRALDDLVQAGKVRYIGTSSFAAWQILESLWASKEYGLDRFCVDQSPYHLLDRRVERELLPMAQTYGIGVTLWSPLAGGMLTGKYRRGEVYPTDWRFGGDSGSDWNRRHMVDPAFAVVDVVTTIADELGCTPVQVALAWGLSHPAVTSTVLGARTLDQLEAQLRAADVVLAPEQRARLDEVATPGRAIVPYYLDDAFADLRPHRYHW
jgi:aryl-alcohol dehydrogenase-like predicted oxidoreductase